MKELVNCINCNKEFYMEIKMCCDGKNCGCMGMPIDPIICDENCYKEYIKKINNKIKE